MKPGMRQSLVRLARVASVRAVVPRFIRDRLRARLLGIDYQRAVCRAAAERLYGGEIPESASFAANPALRVTIVRDHMSEYVHNVRACRDLGVSFDVVDIAGADWLARVRRANNRLLLVWPSIGHSAWKQLYDERLRALVEADRVELVPSLDEVWFQDSKRRVAYWLAANGVPSAETWVFYDHEEARQFVEGARFPLVFKTDSGAASSGVSILRRPREARQIIEKAFGRGIRPRSAAANDRQVGHVLFQEFVPHEHEWRVMRVGEHFLCRKKTRIGTFASGSGTIAWAVPPDGLLDFVRETTDKGGFEHMSLDVFEAPKEDRRGRYLVNEFHCVVGAIVVEGNVNDATGRWTRGAEGAWEFEKGFFYQNACANLRLERAMKRYGHSAEESVKAISVDGLAGEDLQLLTGQLPAFAGLSDGTQRR